MPQVITGYEPSGDNWQFVDEQVVNKAPAGTQTVAEYADSTLLTVAGLDLWGSVSVSDLVNRVQSMGKTVYYISRWRDPGNFLFGTYRVCIVRQA